MGSGHVESRTTMTVLKMLRKMLGVLVTGLDDDRRVLRTVTKTILNVQVVLKGCWVSMRWEVQVLTQTRMVCASKEDRPGELTVHQETPCDFCLC